MVNDLQVNAIFEAYCDGILSLEKTQTLLDACAMSEDPFFEGANTEYRRIYSESSRKMKKSISKLRKMLKNPIEYETEFKAELSEARAYGKEMAAAIKAIPSTVPSTIISWFITAIIDNIKGLLLGVVTFGLSTFAIVLENLIEEFTGIGKAITGEETWTDGLNRMRQRYLRYMGYYNRILDGFEKKFEKALKAAKAKADD